MYKFIFILFAFGLLCAACQKTDLCLQYASNSALVRFRTYTDSLKLKDTTLPAPLIVYDSFANQYGTTPRINVFLNGTTNFSTAILFPDSADLNVFDTLRFYYKPKLNFVSKECGFNYFYDLDSISSNAKNIKKITVLNAAITNKTNLVHFEIVY